MEIPPLGLGTWQITGGDCVEAVRDALELGYRHLDTARAYENEREVGRALAQSGVPRDDVFVTTKVWLDDLEPARLRRSAEASLRDLGLDHVDLLLVHWPSPAVPLAETLAALEELRTRGRTRHIGVSNFPARLLREAIELAPVACDQVEYHPYLQQPRLLQTARAAGVWITAYSPFGHGGVLDDPVIGEIADRRGCTPAQVVLRWLLDQALVATVPKAATHEHRAGNLGALDVELADEDRARIDGLARGRRFIDPPFAPDWDDE